MRVLHIVKTSVGATWAYRQIRELVQLGVEMHAAIPPDGPLTPRYEAAGVVVHGENFDLPVGRPWCWPSLLSRLRDLVSSVRPHIIHSHFVGTTMPMRMALGKTHPTPRVFQVPGPLHLEHRIFREAEIRLAGPQDRWIGSCRWTCRRYEQCGIAKDRINLSFYGSDLEDCRTTARGKLRKELGLGDGVRIIGMVAFMYPPKMYLGYSRGIKGHEDLIDAFSILRKDHPESVCVIIGGAWNNAVSYEQRVREYARRRCGNSVVFLGTRDDVHYLYPDFDVAVHPSLSENLGGAAESLLHGVPTVATNVGGLPDLVTDGKTGWLVPPKDPRALARAIGEALDDPSEARKRAERGRVLARHLLDVKRTARQVYDIYNEILAEK